MTKPKPDPTGIDDLLAILRGLSGQDPAVADRRSLPDWDDAMANATSGIIDAVTPAQRRDALIDTAVVVMAWLGAIRRAPN